MPAADPPRTVSTGANANSGVSSSSGGWMPWIRAPLRRAVHCLEKGCALEMAVFHHWWKLRFVLGDLFPV